MNDSPQREKVFDRINRSTKLPSIPEVVLKLTQMLENTESSTEEIGKLVKLDPVIAGGILRLANTVAFNTRGKISSIDEAIARIGFKNISDLALSLSVIKNFTRDGLLDYLKFWEHALCVAFATQVVQRHSPKGHKYASALYTAGLLHDIGILVFDQVFPDEYRPVLQRAKKEKLPLHELELEMLGVEHAEVGAYVLKMWKLPQVVVDTVRFQYSPNIRTASADITTKVLSIANFACNRQEHGNGAEFDSPEVPAVVWRELGMHPEEISPIMSEVRHETEKATEILREANAR